MENMLFRNVDEIPEANRRSLETLLGRELQEHQRVFIMVLDPSQTPSATTRSAAAQGLRGIMARAASNADAQGISEAEVDAAVDEAMGHVRRRAV